MEKYTFEISGGGNSLIKGYGYGKNTVTVTEMEGWDDFIAFEITTAPKLVGHGSYIISERIAERIVSVTFSIKGTVASAKSQWRDIMNFALAKGVVTLKLTIVDGGTTTETMTGKITGVKPIPSAKQTTLTVDVLCTNPIKTTSNGSTL